MNGVCTVKDKPSIHGVYNIIKPPGPTSNDLVSDVKRLLRNYGYGKVKVGHTGTLDPGAAGVLPICVGKATRLFDYLMDKEKTYLCEICFGVETDTLDAYGSVISRSETMVTLPMLKAVLPQFIGEQRQMPPMYSAVKLNGQKLYQMARNQSISNQARQEARQKKTRTVRIYKIDIIEQTGEQRFLLSIICSKGTYIRVLCEDIAEKLHSVAYMSYLLRTRSGLFDLQEGITLSELSEHFEKNEEHKCLIAVDQAISHLPHIDIEKGYFDRLKNGNAIPVAINGKEDTVVVYCSDTFMGIGLIENKILRMRCLLVQ